MENNKDVNDNYAAGERENDISIPTQDPWTRRAQSCDGEDEKNEGPDLALGKESSSSSYKDVDLSLGERSSSNKKVLCVTCGRHYASKEGGDILHWNYLSKSRFFEVANGLYSLF